MPVRDQRSEATVCHVVSVIRSKVLVSKICGDQIVRTPASTDVNLRSHGAYHIAVAIKRVQETRRIGAGIWLDSPQRVFLNKE